MIRSWYGGNYEVESPRFVQQLESGVAVLQTDAARSLGVSSDGSKSTSAPGQEQDAINADQNLRETPGSTPSMGTSATTNTTQVGGEEGEKDGRGHTQEQNEPSTWQKAWDWVTSLRPTFNVTNNSISMTLSTPNQDGNIRGTFQHPFRQSHAPRSQSESSGQPRIWPAKFDPNSPADNMEARGFNRSLESRMQMASEWDANLPGTPGDVQWGTAYLRELNKRYPW